MNAIRLMMLGALLSLTGYAAAAEKRGSVIFHTADGEERGNVVFHATPGAAVSETMSLMGWGPGTLVSSPAVMGSLFPPTLIMHRQQELALSGPQTEAIKAEMRAFQSQVVDVQWDLQSSQAALESLLEGDSIDPDAAATAIDRVLQAENALKKLHLAMLIKIRNSLEPEQIRKLQQAMRPSHHQRLMLPIPPEPPPA